MPNQLQTDPCKRLSKTYMWNDFKIFWPHNCFLCLNLGSQSGGWANGAWEWWADGGGHKWAEPPFLLKRELLQLLLRLRLLTIAGPKAPSQTCEYYNNYEYVNYFGKAKRTIQILDTILSEHFDYFAMDWENSKETIKIIKARHWIWHQNRFDQFDLSSR